MLWLTLKSLFIRKQGNEQAKFSRKKHDTRQQNKTNLHNNKIQNGFQ